MNSKYLIASLLSGCVWGLIVFALGEGELSIRERWLGVMAFPLIGVVIGILISPTYSWPRGFRIPVPPLALFAGAFLFALSLVLWDGGLVFFGNYLAGVMWGTLRVLPILLVYAYMSQYALALFRAPSPRPH